MEVIIKATVYTIIGTGAMVGLGLFIAILIDLSKGDGYE